MYAATAKRDDCGPPADRAASFESEVRTSEAMLTLALCGDHGQLRKIELWQLSQLLADVLYGVPESAMGQVGVLQRRHDARSDGSHHLVSLSRLGVQH